MLMSFFWFSWLGLAPSRVGCGRIGLCFLVSGSDWGWGESGSRFGVLLSLTLSLPLISTASLCGWGPPSSHSDAGSCLSANTPETPTPAPLSTLWGGAGCGKVREVFRAQPGSSRILHRMQVTNTATAVFRKAPRSLRI